MANLESLNYHSITTQSRAEALERLRLIRESRRVPIKTTKPRTQVQKQKSTKQSLTPEQAAALLKTLLGE